MLCFLLESYTCMLFLHAKMNFHSPYLNNNLKNCTFVQLIYGLFFLNYFCYGLFN
jgi:hypothetical protein